MVGKDSDDQTNLQLYKVGRLGRIKVAGEDDEKNKDAAAFKRLMAKMQEEARPVGYLFGKGALDHDDLLYLKEQNQAEEDAFRQRELEEKRAFAAFKAAASATDLSSATFGAGTSSALTSSTSAKVQPKPRSGIRQSSLLQNIVAVKPRRKDQSLARSDSAGSSLSSPGAAKRPRLDATREVAEKSNGSKDAATSSRSDLGLSGENDSQTTQSDERDSAAKALNAEASGVADIAEDVLPAKQIPGLAKSLSGQGALLGLAYEDSDDESEDT